MTRTSVTTKVYLIERSKGTKKATYYLKWEGMGGKLRSESLGLKSKVGVKQAKQLRQQKEHDLNEGRVPLDKVSGRALGEFRTFYLQHRRRGDAMRAHRTTKEYAKLSDGTITLHDMALRYLIAFFGESRRLDTITRLDGEAWHDALRAGDLASARMARSSRNGKLSENTLRSASRCVKAIFGWARTNGLVHSNPFEGFIGTGIKGKPNPHVPLEDFRKLCEDAPQPWKAMLGLCRLAGLRREEAMLLPWSGTRTDDDGAELEVGIDWDRKRIRTMSTKTGHYREVPIVKELYDILLDAYEQAPEGTERVVHPITKNNLDRDIKKLAKAAGVVLWRKPYQSLRSSCENEWKAAGVPEPTYASWIGHGLEVSRKHYVAPLDSEFDAITCEV